MAARVIATQQWRELLTSTRDVQADKITIIVTPAAKQAIAQLKETNGDLIFHLPGGCCDARTPVCLPKGDLSLGPRDRLIGHADGIPVYEMGENAGRSYELDVSRGIPVGFSLSPGDGQCFSLRETRG